MSDFNLDEIPEDIGDRLMLGGGIRLTKERNAYIATCAFCFEHDVRCVPVTYERVNKFYEQKGVTPFAMCCCEYCFKSDRTELFIRYLDGIIIMELARYLNRKCQTLKDPVFTAPGVIQNDNDFYTFKQLALTEGVFGRETKRHKNLRHRKMLRAIMKDRQKFSPNLLSRQMLQSLFSEGGGDLTTR